LRKKTFANNFILFSRFGFLGFGRRIDKGGLINKPYERGKTTKYFI
jgi:hypothetical protein